VPHDPQAREDTVRMPQPEEIEDTVRMPQTRIPAETV
jgi:hypothetical protein